MQDSVSLEGSAYVSVCIVAPGKDIMVETLLGERWRYAGGGDVWESGFRERVGGKDGWMGECSEGERRVRGRCMGE